MEIYQLKEACRQYGWERIFSNFSGLSQALQKGKRHQPCPKTGDGKDNFRFFKDYQDTGGAYSNSAGPLPDGIELLCWYNDASKHETLSMLEDIVGGANLTIDVKKVSKPKPRPYCTPQEQSSRQEIIKRYYTESQPIQGTKAETYLRSRGINGFSHGFLTELGNNLRFHPSLPYREDDDSPWQHFPCLLAVVRDKNGTPLTLHRTFLSPDGQSKAPVSRAKMVLAPPRDMRGGYIMLDKPTNISTTQTFIGISEGIENGLSAREGAGCPMFVGLSDKLMAMINLLPSTSAVAFYSDIEVSGAGQTAVEDFKLKNPSVRVHNEKPFLPHGRDKVDWNDLYQLHGQKAFRTKIKPQCRIPNVDFADYWSSAYAKVN